MPNQPRLHSRVLRRGSAGVTLGLALTLSVTGMSAAEAAGSTAHSKHDPHGTFSVTLKGRHAHLWGTAVDPDSSRPTTVRLIIAGHKPVTVRTNPKTHAYAHWFWLSYGTHRVRAKAANVGAGTSKVLGAKVVKVVNLNPVGTAAVKHTSKVAKFYGKVLDRSAPHSALTLRLWHNGHLVRQVKTNASSRRFVVSDKLSSGTNSFRLVAVNKGSGTRNTTMKRVKVYKGAAWVAKYHGNQRIAAAMLPKYGWGESQMRALVQMWNRESGWNSRAANSSGAYGIPQSLPGSKMASAGSDWRTSARTQIKWGLGYIKARYGSPINAWSTWQNQGSY